MNFGTNPYVWPTRPRSFSRYFIADGSEADGFGVVGSKNTDLLNAKGNEDVELWECTVTPTRRIAREASRIAQDAGGAAGGSTTTDKPPLSAWAEISPLGEPFDVHQVPGDYIAWKQHVGSDGVIRRSEPRAAWPAPTGGSVSRKEPQQ